MPASAPKAGLAQKRLQSGAIPTPFYRKRWRFAANSAPPAAFFPKFIGMFCTGGKLREPV